MVRSFPLDRIRSPLVRAEVAAAGWELFSALLFAAAVVPAALGMRATSLGFLVSMVLSAALAKALLPRGETGYGILALVRVAAWSLSILPLVAATGEGGLVAALAFGVMAGGMRRAIYRNVLEPVDRPQDDAALRDSLRLRLTESATTAGIVGGHVMLLFSVAFLRTQSDVMFRAWFQVVPILALLGTTGFALAVRPLTARVIAALEAGPGGDREVLARGAGDDAADGDEQERERGEQRAGGPHVLLQRGRRGQRAVQADRREQRDRAHEHRGEAEVPHHALFEGDRLGPDLDARPA